MRERERGRGGAFAHANSRFRPLFSGKTPAAADGRKSKCPLAARPFSRSKVDFISERVSVADAVMSRLRNEGICSGVFGRWQGTFVLSTHM